MATARKRPRATSATDRRLLRVWLPILGAVAVASSVLTATAIHLWLTPPAVTREDLAEVVAAHLREHPPVGEQGPPGLQGPPGEPGEPGPAPTAEQLRDAVAAYMQGSETSWCPPGTELEDVRYGTTDGKGCVAD